MTVCDYNVIKCAHRNLNWYAHKESLSNQAHQYHNWSTVNTSSICAWLNALPVAALGLCIDDETTSLLWASDSATPLCSPHECGYCGIAVEDLATHSLSCHRSEGWHPHHAAVNDNFHRALASAKVPSQLEASGLFRSNGKCPDEQLKSAKYAALKVSHHFVPLPWKRPVYSVRQHLASSGTLGDACAR